MSVQEIKKPFTVWIAHIFVWIFVAFGFLGILFNVSRLFTERVSQNLVYDVIGGSSIAVVFIWAGWGLHKLIRNRRKIARPILGMSGIAFTLFLVSTSEPPAYPVSHVYSTTSDVIQYSVLFFGITISILVGTGKKSRAYFSTLLVKWNGKAPDQSDEPTDSNSD